MKIGLTGNIGSLGHRLPAMARAVEELGFECFLAGEHIIVPVEIASPVRHGVMLPEVYKHLPDPFVVLSVMAAVTTRLTLGTNICIVPQRNALILPKEIATLDQISQGRFIFGIGNGWIEEEFSIFKVPFGRRVAKANEDIEILKRLWTDVTPSYDGEFTTFPAVHANPKPWRKPHPPILIGAGGSETDNTAVLKRVARIADGWQPLNLSPGQMKDQLGQLRDYCAQAGRDYSAMDITLIVPSTAFHLDEVTGSAPSTSQYALDLVGLYEEAGVTRIAVMPVPLKHADDPWGKTLETYSARLGLH